MNKSKHAHEWWDYSWNPISGCEHLSAGCDNCYAAAIANRFGRPWGRPYFHRNRLQQPMKVKTPSRVFVGSMTDLGQTRVYSNWIERIADAMREAYWHTYIVLTKRPKTLRFDLLPAETWVGVTIENLSMTDRWMWLAGRWDGVRFISFEPMLEDMNIIDFKRSATPPDWIVVGPETGLGARACKDEWIDDLLEKHPCVFDKRKTGWKRREWPGKF